VRNLGILIFAVPIILAPFDAQPRIEGILRFSFRIVGIILAVLGIIFIAVASKHLLKVAGPEQIPRERMVVLILLALIKFLEEPMLTRGQILGVQKRSANAFFCCL